MAHFRFLILVYIKIELDSGRVEYAVQRPNMIVGIFYSYILYYNGTLVTKL